MTAIAVVSKFPGIGIVHPLSESRFPIPITKVSGVGCQVSGKRNKKAES
jgi:hypothetical protein